MTDGTDWDAAITDERKSVSSVNVRKMPSGHFQDLNKLKLEKADADTNTIIKQIEKLTKEISDLSFQVESDMNNKKEEDGFEMLNPLRKSASVTSTIPNTSRSTSRISQISTALPSSRSESTVSRFIFDSEDELPIYKSTESILKTDDASLLSLNDISFVGKNDQDSDESKLDVEDFSEDRFTDSDSESRYSDVVDPGNDSSILDEKALESAFVPSGDKREGSPAGKERPFEKETILPESQENLPARETKTSGPEHIIEERKRPTEDEYGRTDREVANDDNKKDLVSKPDEKEVNDSKPKSKETENRVMKSLFPHATPQVSKTILRILQEGTERIGAFFKHDKSEQSLQLLNKTLSELKQAAESLQPKTDTQVSNKVSPEHGRQQDKKQRISVATVASSESSEKEFLDAVSDGEFEEARSTKTEPAEIVERIYSNVRVGTISEEEGALSKENSSATPKNHSNEDREKNPESFEIIKTTASIETARQEMSKPEERVSNIPERVSAVSNVEQEDSGVAQREEKEKISDEISSEPAKIIPPSPSPETTIESIDRTEIATADNSQSPAGSEPDITDENREIPSPSDNDPKLISSLVPENQDSTQLFDAEKSVSTSQEETATAIPLLETSAEKLAKIENADVTLENSVTAVPSSPSSSEKTDQSSDITTIPIDSAGNDSPAGTSLSDNERATEESLDQKIETGGSFEKDGSTAPTAAPEETDVPRAAVRSNFMEKIEKILTDSESTLKREEKPDEKELGQYEFEVINSICLLPSFWPLNRFIV